MTSMTGIFSTFLVSTSRANIGDSSHEQILKTIEQYKNKGITLSTVGFGSGNYKDVMMEQLADKGDGNYTYIDGEEEARKVFSEQVDGLLQVVARDVTRSVTNQVIGGMAAKLGKQVGGQLGGSIGRTLVRGALGGLLRR